MNEAHVNTYATLVENYWQAFTTHAQIKYALECENDRMKRVRLMRLLLKSHDRYNRRFQNIISFGLTLTNDELLYCAHHFKGSI